MDEGTFQREEAIDVASLADPIMYERLAYRNCKEAIVLSSRIGLLRSCSTV